MSNHNWRAVLQAHLPGRRWLWLGVVIIGSAVAIVATHLDVARVLSNPALLIGGALLVGIHVIMVVLAVLMAHLAKKR